MPQMDIISRDILVDLKGGGGNSKLHPKPQPLILRSSSWSFVRLFLRASPGVLGMGPCTVQFDETK
jgi:hypothetical protein